ncbi:MAG: glutaredoxin family protein [Deltaproteobacteria bacterium]|nr:glutaredoxin family protein [Deltaproteobacteria bacterium]
MEVKLYTLSTCSHCRAAKQFLRDAGVDFTFIDVDLLETIQKSAVIQEIRKLNPRLTFPTIVVGDRVIVGFKEQEVREALCL